MGAFSWVHIAILAAVALVLLGRSGNVSEPMGDCGKVMKASEK